MQRTRVTCKRQGNTDCFMWPKRRRTGVVKEVETFFLLEVGLNVLEGEECGEGCSLSSSSKCEVFDKCDSDGCATLKKDMFAYPFAFCKRVQREQKKDGGWWMVEARRITRAEVPRMIFRGGEENSWRRRLRVRRISKENASTRALGEWQAVRFQTGEEEYDDGLKVGLCSLITMEQGVVRSQECALEMLVSFFVAPQPCW